MSHVITAIYEHGVLHPLTPPGLREHQRVHVQIVPEERQDTIEHVLESMGDSLSVPPGLLRDNRDQALLAR